MARRILAALWAAVSLIGCLTAVTEAVEVSAAAAVLMESNRTVPETIEHVEVTGGTFLLQVCVVY